MLSVCFFALCSLTLVECWYLLTNIGVVFGLSTICIISKSQVASRKSQVASRKSQVASRKSQVGEPARNSQVVTRKSQVAIKGETSMSL